MIDSTLAFTSVETWLNAEYPRQNQLASMANHSAIEHRDDAEKLGEVVAELRRAQTRSSPTGDPRPLQQRGAASEIRFEPSPAVAVRTADLLGS